ncbi:hypothetical protein WJ0W_003340 [Paenibacillus melissococcoides]|uniref:Uncharacterized protein n=1 Tax=Paenibacillus melissococcoides TaxID=2912268 RepID=A0ABN8U6W0_9BACL|nr:MULTISPECIES: hypothetical protein [Paenibacillus]MEB9893225.1 hypothetical protein [Bacillus cereus]CAH8246103.1 hypothetical protein WJ0W_003340 [Paenibacillus melissococcoides]CAH8712981.1 hypothetical protein WDD9_003418 [Paenibacillus melissococcoides]CAH8713714.1 hypothetical protein HTL2_003721 [Paenibacillus melissococcoides]GIO78695.1 hypothetical protein J6TS7_23050 [Paenibacillus dendritiformis]
MEEPILKLQGEYGTICISIGDEDPEKVMDDIHSACAAAILVGFSKHQKQKLNGAAV